MGIRIAIQLPYIGDDRSALFGIRHTPIIPHCGLPFPGAVAYWQDNFPVRTVTRNRSGITITQHSPPPHPSIMAFHHRYWTGSIKYRLNAVTNFTASGYVWVTKMRNVVSVNQIDHPDAIMFRHVSTRDGMPSAAFHSSFLRSDISMFRHIEIESPYEYIVPFQDTFFELNESLQLVDSNGARTRMYDTPRPNNWDWLIVGIRGSIASADTSNTLYYELEYCLGDDFQFALPLLPSPVYLVSPYTFTEQANGNKDVENVLNVTNIDSVTISLVNTYGIRSFSLPLPPPSTSPSDEVETRNLVSQFSKLLMPK
ncbi:VP3 [Cat Tien Hospitalitermes polycipi-like virus]|nr:VP3 [Cat Tien Hospitalitermes polycipi-like virus]